MTIIAERRGAYTVSGSKPKGGTRVYAIAFDMDTKALEEAWGNPNWRNAYGQIRDHLAGKGFTPQQGSVYFGNEDVTPVTTVLAVQSLAETFSWFSASVRDIRMLRIEENNDLLPAIAAVVPIPPKARRPEPDSLFDVFDQGEPLGE